MLMAEVLEKSLLLAEMACRKTVPCAILTVKMDTMASALSAGRVAHHPSLILESTALNHLPTVVESDILSGTKPDAKETILKVARNGELSGILNAEKASTILDAVSALQTALLVLLTLVFHAKKTLMAEAGVKFLAAPKTSKCQVLSVTLHANPATTATAQFAGKIALLESILAVLFALTQLMPALLL